jgi:hypothetical protein
VLCSWLSSTVLFTLWKLTNQGLQRQAVDHDLIRLLSHRYCFEVLPLVDVDPGLSWPFVSQKIGNYDHWLQTIKTGPWHSIILDYSDLKTSQLQMFDPLWDRMQTDIQKMNRRLLKTASERKPTTSSSSELQ